MNMLPLDNTINDDNFNDFAFGLPSMSSGGGGTYAVAFAAGTQLTTGSAAIISYQEDGGFTWSIVLLDDIEAGTEFSFTDNGWKAGGGFLVGQTGDSGALTFTAGQALSAGTVITFTNTTAVLAGTATSVGTLSGTPLDFSAGGSNGQDQIFMYQGSFDAVTGATNPDFQFITAYHANGAWDSDATDVETSARPIELTNYSVDQSGLGQKDNAVYVGPTGGTVSEIWQELQDQNNWVGGGNPEADPYLSGFNALSDFTVVGTDPYIFTPDSPLFEANSTGNIITGISIADADSDRVSVTLTVEGTVTLAQTTGLNFITGDGVDDSTVTFSGLIEDVNAALDGLFYTPATDDIDGDTLQIIVSDGSAVIAPGAFPSTIDLSALDGTDGFSIDGLAQADRLGYDVSYAGDINGDGIDDIIIGAPYADDGVLIDHDNNPETPLRPKNFGEAYVIYGTDAGFSDTIDLTAIDGSNGFKITNVNGYQGDELGHAVSNLGDINNDGYDDFAVGSFNANKDNGMGGTTNDVGKTWVIFGTGSAMPATFDVSSLNGTNGFVVQGDRADDYAGRVITAGGDINGDGIDDFIIAADRTDTPGDKAGGVYVIYGTESGFDATIDLADVETGDGSVGTYIHGAAQGDRAGRDVHSAGDINGDGLDDIIIGAYQSTFDADGNLIEDHYAGKAFVVFGQNGGLGTTVDLGALNGSNGFTMDGLAAEDITGRGVSTAGDINGDGFDDIIIGAPLSDANGQNSGAVYVVYGTDAGFAANVDLSALNGTNGFTIIGESADSWIGFDLANLGDINGDGIDDILIGSTSSLPSSTHDLGPTDSNNGNTNGAYVLFGSDSGFSATLDLASLDGTNGFQLPDVLPGDNTGFAVSTAGDLNHDGIADMIISANGADPNGSNSGRVYVVFGNANISTSYISQNLAIQLEAPPVIADMDGDMATFTEGDAFTLLDTGTAVSITDAESTDFDGGSLDIQFATGQVAEDGLIVDTSSTVALSAGQTAGSEVSVGGTVIGTIVAGETGASGEGLQFALNADATPALVQTLLAAIGYTNSAGDVPTAGDRTFTITLDDGDGADGAVTTTVTVVAVDDAPTLTPPAAQSFAVNSTGNSITGLSVGDIDSATVTVTLTVEGTITLAQTTGLTFDAGADGTSTMTITGSVADVNAAIATLTYAPATDDRDGDTLSMSVTDGTTPVADTVAIALTNTDPVAADDDVSVSEDGPALAGDVLADNGNGADSDANNDTLTVTHVNGIDTDVGQQVTLASGALLTLNSDGTFTYDPNGQFEGLDETETDTDSFTYTVDDGFGGSSEATATVTIQGANDLPVAVVPVGQSFAVNSTGNTIAGLSFSDVDDDTATVTLTAEGIITLAQTTGLTFDAGADGSSTMTISGTVADLNAAIATLTYAPATDDRDGDTISISINDGTGITNGSIAVTLTNTIPVAEDDAVSVDESGTLSGDVLADNGNGADSDGNGDTLSISEVNGVGASVGQQITLTSGALLTLNSDGTFSYDPNGAFDSLAVGETDTDTFTYTVSDGFGGTDTATVTITINGENEAPVAQDDAASLGESGTLSGDVFADNGNGIDDDANGDTLSVIEVNGQPLSVGQQITLGSGALLTLNSDGTFAYDPNGAFDALTNGESDTDSFTYTISDGNGGTDMATATITISGENENPVAEDDAVSVDETASLNGDVLADNGNGIDDDADGDTLTVTHVNGSETDIGTQITLASGALLTLNSDGTFAYDTNGAFDSLAVGETDTDSFTYTVDDGFGGTDTATVTITINGENDGPSAMADLFMVSEDGPALAGDVLADNGAGADSDPNNDTLTVTEVNGQTANVGTQITLTSGALLTLNADGTFSYDPNGAFDSLEDGASGVDSFTYTISDGNGGTDTATATINVSGVNDAPQEIVPGPQSFLVNSSGNALSGISITDADDNQLLVTLSVEGKLSLGQTTGLTFTLGDGTNDSAMAFTGSLADINAALAGLTYTPTAGDRDGDTLSLGAFDGDKTSTQSIAISLDNAAPSASDDAFGTGDTGPSVSGDVLADNGSGADSDLNGDALTVTAVNGSGAGIGNQITLTSGALLTLNADGTFDYDPNGAYQGLLPGETGTDSFTYTVEDGFGGSDTATVTITLVGSLEGDDVIIGTGLDDELVGGSGNDTLKGGPGDDDLYGGEGDDFLSGQTGNDTVKGGTGNDTLYGGDGDDFLSGQAGDDVLNGNTGNDTLYGGDGADQLNGNNGMDTLIGNAGNDTLYGGADNDTLLGADGDDLLYGQHGDDTLVGGTGTDELYGGSGDDDLSGQSGDDTLVGGTGNDALHGGSGLDTLIGGSGADVLEGNEDNDHLLGSTGDDTLDGGSGDDELRGQEDNDVLDGNIGNDTLYGGSGDDRLVGGSGDDALYGNTGVDTFVFDASHAGSDTVFDFASGETVELTGFGYGSDLEAASHFSQAGNHVVFTDGDVTVTFRNADLADVIAAINLPQAGGGGAETVAPQPVIGMMLALLLDETGFVFDPDMPLESPGLDDGLIEFGHVIADAGKILVQEHLLYPELDAPFYGGILDDAVSSLSVDSFDFDIA